MKIVFAILLIVALALATPSCTPSDLSRCGIDRSCWTCRDNRCHAENDGHTCDDQNPLTYNDKCQHNGDCVGQSMMCIPCTTDASCGDTLSLVGRVRAGLWQWMMPWQSLNCLNASCLTEPNTGRKCCGFVPTPKVQCDANDPLTICWNDGSCKPAPLTGTELCQRVSEHCNTVFDCDPIPNLSPCLQLLCTRGACNVGYKPSGAVCGINGVCNGRGQCNVTCTHGTSTCPTEMELCGQGQICTTIATDPQNCGACGSICDDVQACLNGTCVYLCPTTESMCSGKCVDLTSDNQNCGTCGVACASGYKCTNSTCKVSCLYGHTLCGTTCADFTSDSNNCGACGVVCGTGKACVNSVCTLLCNSPLVPCNGMCADTTTNPTCCGSGHSTCASGSVCISGVCTPLCPYPRVSCSGMCEDLLSDFNNCGACNHACLTNQACSLGSCIPLCLSPKIVCGAGTCIDNLTDSSNCGTCGHACPTGQQCIAGTCTLVCPAGQTKCAGVCVQLSTSPNNCGSCGVVCPAGAAHTQGVCVSGVCETACTPYYADCDHNSTNGCESDPSIDYNNCGSCGHKCGFEQYCSSGTCQKATLIYIISGDHNPTEVYNIATGRLNSSYPAYPTYGGAGINYIVTGISVNNSIYILSDDFSSSPQFVHASVFNKITHSWNSGHLTSYNLLLTTLSMFSQVWMSGNTMVVVDENGNEFKYDISTNTISNPSSTDVGSISANGGVIHYLPHIAYVQAAGSYPGSAGFVSAANGRIYLSEYSGYTCTNQFSVYNTTSKVKSLANVPTIICEAQGGAIAYGNKIYVAGGYTTGFTLTKVFQVYDIISNTWAQLPQLQYTHIYTTLVVG